MPVVAGRITKSEVKFYCDSCQGAFVFEDITPHGNGVVCWRCKGKSSEQAMIEYEKRIAELQDRFSRFQEGDGEAACTAKRCTYYAHYLAWGPADLTHEGYHAADSKRKFFQGRCIEWHEAHPSAEAGCPYCDMADLWEERTRA